MGKIYHFWKDKKIEDLSLLKVSFVLAKPAATSREQKSEKNCEWVWGKRVIVETNWIIVWDVAPTWLASGISSGSALKTRVSPARRLPRQTPYFEAKSRFCLLSLVLWIERGWLVWFFAEIFAFFSSLCAFCWLFFNGTLMHFYKDVCRNVFWVLDS